MTLPARTAQPETLALPIELIDPSKTNPRKRGFDEASLRELANSMAPPLGILEPLIVRAGEKTGRYEIIAGERRFRAAKLAKLTHVPAVVRELSDLDVVRAQLVENHQRKDVHPLEEAHGMARLLDMDSTQTPKSVASAIGMSERYVQNRIHYLKLTQDVQDAFFEDRITSGHADLIVRLDKEQQTRALAACFDELKLLALPDKEQEAIDAASDLLASGEKPSKYDKELLGKRKPEDVVPIRLRSVRELDDWIKVNVRATVQQLQAELPELDAAVEAAASDGRKVIEISFLRKSALPQTYMIPEKDREATLAARKRVVFVGDWKRADGSKKTTPADEYSDKMIDSPKCDAAKLGVVTLGPDPGLQLMVCVDKKSCKVHWGAEQRRAKENRVTYGGHSSAPETAESREKRAAREKAENSERQRLEKVWNAVRGAIPGAVKNIPAAKQTKLLQALLADRLRANSYYGYGRPTIIRTVLKPAGLNIDTLEAAIYLSNPQLRRQAEKKAAPKKAAKTPGVKRAEKSVKKAQARVATKKHARKAGKKR